VKGNIMENKKQEKTLEDKPNEDAELIRLEKRLEKWINRRKLLKEKYNESDLNIFREIFFISEDVKDIQQEVKAINQKLEDGTCKKPEDNKSCCKSDSASKQTSKQSSDDSDKITLHNLEPVLFKMNLIGLRQIDFDSVFNKIQYYLPNKYFVIDDKGNLYSSDKIINSL